MRHFRNFELEKCSVDAGYCSCHNGSVDTGYCSGHNGSVDAGYCSGHSGSVDAGYCSVHNAEGPSCSRSEVLFLRWSAPKLVHFCQSGASYFFSSSCDCWGVESINTCSGVCRRTSKLPFLSLLIPGALPKHRVWKVVWVVCVSLICVY